MRRLLNLIWYVNAPVVLMVRGTPALCLHMLATAARPSTERLHLRSVFTSGRRYQIEATSWGFRLMTTSKVMWHYRRRTSSAAVINATVTALDEHITRIHLQARTTIAQLLNVFLIPAFITSIIVFMPWSRPLIAGLSASMFTLSWMAHRNNAALEANEMVYFIEKALEELIAADVTSLQAESPAVVVDFKEAWDKFYQEHQKD